MNRHRHVTDNSRFPLPLDLLLSLALELLLELLDELDELEPLLLLDLEADLDRDRAAILCPLLYPTSQSNEDLPFNQQDPRSGLQQC